MGFDEDIKIVGNKPSLDVRHNKIKENLADPITAEEFENAKKLGEVIANKYILEAENPLGLDEGEYSPELIRQMRLLLSFTATVGFERFCKNETVAGLAQKSFIDILFKEGGEIYNSSSDTGAFSFYYLAFRRGTDVERRMGQTFAMLCSSDGDPIFQERGEALYCWFSAEIRKAASELKLARL